MRRTFVLLLIVDLMALGIAACGKVPASDTVESLVADPERLKEIMRQCREAHAKMGDAECSAASEAFRRRFMGDAKGKYTP
jgi:conjugative transfer region protein TrbK